MKIQIHAVTIADAARLAADMTLNLRQWEWVEDRYTYADVQHLFNVQNPSPELIGSVLRAHQPTTGMSVAMGVTCRCGYWNGNEDPGRTRPVGFQGLQWHQAEEISKALRGVMDS